MEVIVEGHGEEGTLRGTDRLTEAVEDQGWGSRGGEMNGPSWTDGRSRDGWMAVEVCLLAAPSPPPPGERNGGWHIRGLLGRLMEMI